MPGAFARVGGIEQPGNDSRLISALTAAPATTGTASPAPTTRSPPTAATTGSAPPATTTSLDGGAGNDILVAATAARQGDIFNYRPGLCAGRADRLRPPRRRRHRRGQHPGLRRDHLRAAAGTDDAERRRHGDHLQHRRHPPPSATSCQGIGWPPTSSWRERNSGRAPRRQDNDVVPAERALAREGRGPHGKRATRRARPNDALRESSRGSRVSFGSAHSPRRRAVNRPSVRSLRSPGTQSGR